MRAAEAVRRFATSSALSYRALFTWLNPYGYVSSRIAFPVFVALLFGLVGEESGNGAVRPVVGGSLLAIALSALFGTALAVGNERQFGTLGAWLSTPAGLVSTLAGKIVPHLLDGMLGATLTFVVAAAVFDVDVSAGQAGMLAVVAVATAASSAGAAMIVAAAVFAWRDVFTPPNVLLPLLMLLTGALAPLAALPVSPEWLSSALPLTHAVEAGLTVVESSRLPAGRLVAEVAVGAVWAVVGYGALRWSVGHARRRGTALLS